MSLAEVRAALETHLAAITPALDTAYENYPYSPTPGTPWQDVFLVPIDPEHVEMGANFTERGIFRVNLHYPLDAGPGAATTRAELIRTAFKRGTTLASGSITTHIETHPEVSPARIEDDRYFLPVRIRYYAFVTGV